MIYSSAEGPIDSPTIDIVSYCFDRQVDYDETKPILIDTDEPSRSLSAASLRTLVRKLIAGFKAIGLQDGDCVFCQLPNSYFYSAIYFAIVGAGGVWCGSNPANQAFEVDHFVELGKPRFIVTGSHGLPTVLDVCEKRQIAKDSILVVDSDSFPCITKNIAPPSTRPFTDLLCHGEQDWRVIADAEQLKSTPAAYFSTSGTTGLPKLAMLSHHNMVAHHMMFHNEVPYEPSKLISLPFFHLFGSSLAFVQPIRYGQQAYIMKRFNLEKYLHTIHKYQLTETYMAPPMLVSIIQSPLNVKDLLKTVRYAGVGGAPIDALSINKMRALLPANATMTSIWGMTEVGVATSFRYGENDETGSVGRLNRGMEGKLIDSDENVVEKDGEPGELYCRTQGVMLGYRNMPFADEEKEWFRTGDVCCFREGKLYVVGRAKELIKVKGWQVAPAELEAVLLQNPDIIDAAVVGTMAEDGVTEVPRAYVIRRKKLHEDQMITADEVYKFARTRLASYKALDGGVCFVEEIPRTPSGKIQRSKLSRMDEYRQSVTSVLLASTVSTTPQDAHKVEEITNTAMLDVEMAEPKVDTAPCPRRSSRLSSNRSQGSSSSDEAHPAMRSLTMRRKKKTTTSSVSSDGTRSTSPTNPTKAGIRKKRRSKTEKFKKLVKAVQAVAA